MPDYLVHEEDGTSRFTLEETGGSLLLEGGPFVYTKAGYGRVGLIGAGYAVLGKARVSQLAVEVIVQPDSDARVSQVPVEVIHRVLHETVSVVIWD